MNNYTTTAEAQPCVSFLREVFTPKDGKPTLHQAKITEMVPYDSFRAFAQDFRTKARYPSPQSQKFETYGWTPTLFDESDWVPKSAPFKEPKRGLWRVGDYSVGEVTVAYFDLDNHHDDQPVVSIDEVEAVLRALGLSFMLYTSFSHKADKHKVRIVLPASRNMDYDTAFLTFVFFNHLFHYQLDGSIYDPGDHLYGPTYAGEYREWLDGGSLDVDAVLTDLDGLPDKALEYAKRSEAGHRSDRVLTAEELEALRVQMANPFVGAGLSLDNPAHCRPEWLRDHDGVYKEGSHRQTLMGTLSRIWLYSKRTLSMGELRALQRDLDARWGYYCQRKYGSAVLKDDIRSVMALSGSMPTVSASELQQSRLAANLKRLANKGAV